MGRRAAFRHTADVIGPDYAFKRDELVEALEQEGPGVFVHPHDVWLCSRNYN
jgi:prophage DNA circulation protein